MIRAFVTIFAIALASGATAQIHWTGVTRCNDLNYIYMAPTGDAYCLSQSLGIMKSTNKGISWRPVNAGTDVGRMNRITWTTQGFFAVTKGHIYRSTDNGESWSDLKLINKHNVITETPDHTALLLGTSSGVMRSVDSGATWVSVGTDVIKTWIEDIAFNSEGVGYAVSSKLYRTTDNGVTWDSLWDNGSAVYRRIAFDAQGRIYLGGYKLLRSEDEGKTWTELQFADISTPPEVMSIDFHQGMIFISSAKTFQSFQGPGLFYSSDDGLTWKLDIEFADEGIAGIVSDSLGYLYAGAFFSGNVYRSTKPLAVGKTEPLPVQSTSLTLSLSDPQNVLATLEELGIRSIVDITGKAIRLQDMSSVQPGIYLARSESNVVKVLLLP